MWLIIVGVCLWAIAALSITALSIGVLLHLPTEKAKAPRTVENPVDTLRGACDVCGAHRTFTEVKYRKPLARDAAH
jgi:hypothetical protein